MTLLHFLREVLSCTQAMGAPMFLRIIRIATTSNIVEGANDFSYITNDPPCKCS